MISSLDLKIREIQMSSPLKGSLYLRNSTRFVLQWLQRERRHRPQQRRIGRRIWWNCYLPRQLQRSCCHYHKRADSGRSMRKLSKAMDSLRNLPSFQRRLLDFPSDFAMPPPESLSQQRRLEILIELMVRNQERRITRFNNSEINLQRRKESYRKATSYWQTCSLTCWPACWMSCLSCSRPISPL
ncbi:hypothetical protein NE237_024164 [Protea cynaroides]|uniref:Uncharacterized protein n=1 Tax=Protea cynaroides TaxID=273540 RepID=A0A9Q0HGF4_9MAGN|nr:hypothetical protein NE237_024164 [Protea cynaroides]